MEYIKVLDFMVVQIGMVEIMQIGYMKVYMENHMIIKIHYQMKLSQPSQVKLLQATQHAPIKQIPQAENTIILVAGDHNVRSILNYEKVPQRYMHAVPLYMYLPQSLMNGNIAKKEITERYGSHYDILPTLAPLCIKENVEYLSIGNNLLDTTKTNDEFYSYNEKQLLAPDEANKDSIAAMIEARKLLMKIYYQQGFREKNNRK